METRCNALHNCGGLGGTGVEKDVGGLRRQAEEEGGKLSKVDKEDCGGLRRTEEEGGRSRVERAEDQG